MQVSFDPRDPDQCSSVIATILALHGRLPEIVFDEGGTQDSRLLPESLDAEAAFAPPVPPLPNPGGVEVDSRGLPWDARIHSGPSDKRPMNADRSWRKARGVTDEQIAQVEAELRAALGAPPAPPTPAPAPEVAAVPIPPVAAPPPPVPAVAVPTAAPIAPEPTPVAASTESGQVVAAPAVETPAPVASFADLMRKITGLQTAGRLTVEDTAQISASLGITGVRDLMTRPDLIPAFDALLPALVPA